MNIQTRASFRKESLAFFRTGKFIVIAIVFLGWAMLSPLIIRGLGGLMDSMSPIYDDLGMDVSGMTELLGSSASIGVSSAISEMSSLCLLVFLLLINSFAGGEQKKRSVIIPRSAGLRSFSYIFPKFIVYPLSAFVLAITGTFLAWWVSSGIFAHNDVTLLGAFLGGTLAGTGMMFYICFHLTIGTATGKAGMSAAICIVSSFLLPNIFAVLGSEYVYNPFILSLYASSLVSETTQAFVQPMEVVMTVLIALAIMAIVFFLALFAQNAKTVDNSGNEIRI